MGTGNPPTHGRSSFVSKAPTCQHSVKIRGNELNKQDAFVQILRKLVCVDRYFYVSVYFVYLFEKEINV